MSAPLRVGWYTTGRGQGSRGMFEAVRTAIADRSLDAEFAFVFCNREPGEDATTDDFFDLVRSAGIPLLTLSSVGFRKAHGGERSRPGEPLPEWRAAYDAEVARLVDPHSADVGVLAGYMLIFTAPFVLTRPVLNLHPALPSGPIGTWREVIRALIRDGAQESGVMTHLAIPQVDAGPVASFCRYAIRGEGFDDAWARVDRTAGDQALEASDLFARIRAAGLVREAPFLVSTVQAFAARRLVASGVHLLDAEGLEARPVDLTEEVETRLRAEARP